MPRELLPSGGQGAIREEEARGEPLWGISPVGGSVSPGVEERMGRAY